MIDATYQNRIKAKNGNRTVRYIHSVLASCFGKSS